MLRLLLFFCLALSGVLVSGQSFKKYAFTITPTLLPIGNVAVSPGFQFRVNSRYSLITEVAIPLTHIATGNYQEAHFFRVSTEIKYYLHKPLDGKFVGLKIGYASRRFLDKDSGKYRNHFFGDKEFLYSSAKINSPFVFATAKWGREIIDWKKFYLDYFVGVGVKLITTAYDAENVSSSPVHITVKDPKIFKDWPSWEFDRNYVRINGSLGFRVGIRF